MIKYKRPKVGDCFVIPLPDEKMAYGQYVLWAGDPVFGMGCLVRIFDLIVEEEVPLEALRNASLMFPPVYVGLTAAVKSGRWRVIGQLPVLGFVPPKFRTSFHMKPGTYHDWVIWQGATSVRVGDLPEKDRSLELHIVWGYKLLEERIATGINPFGQVF